MAIIVELPRLSDTMEEGVVAAWKIKLGDKVKRGQVIAEIETDKATMEFESFDPGVVLALVADEGQTLAIGTPIAVLGKAGEDIQGVLQEIGQEKNGGEALKNSLAGSDSPVEHNQGSVATPNDGAALDELSSSDQDRKLAASPVARRMAREAELNLASIQGSGPHGRIVKADVERAIQGATPGKTRNSGKPITVARTSTQGRDSLGGYSVGSSPIMLNGGGKTLSPAGWSEMGETDEHGRPYMRRESRPVPLTQMRKTIAKRMTQSQQEVPHFYLTIAIDMDQAAIVRSQYNLAISGTKVSYNDMLILAAAKALRQHPRCNASWTPSGIVEHGDIHIGVAVALDDGLIVPVVRYADQKSLKAISIEVRDLGKRAKKKALRPEEMVNSTFSVSNLGMFGIQEFAAVVNPGEGGILAVGQVAEEPVVVNGDLRSGKRMKATLSCDHRVIDGAVGAQLLATFRDFLEYPMKLFS